MSNVISGDPNLSKIIVSPNPTAVQTTISVGTFPNQSPVASSHAAASPSATGPGTKSFNRDTATNAIKARCSQLTSEGKTPSEDWPGKCAVPNIGANWVVPAQQPGSGGCQWARGQSDIDFSMQINVDNDECMEAGYGTLKFDEDECNKSFQAIVDVFPDYNDLSKKYGGTFYSIGCWMYAIQPFYYCTGYANPCPEVKDKYCEAGWADACSS